MRLINTSWLIELLKRGSYEEGSISVITLIEVLRGIGADKRGVVKRLLEENYDVIGLSNEVIKVYCNLYDELKRREKVIPDADLPIASTAIAHNLTLKTRDKHFTELRDLGLKLELME